MDEIERNIEQGKEFIRSRITELRIKADVSEYEMSLELGQNRSYIQFISSGKAMPSMAGFLNICDYFDITPAEFFDRSVEEPQLLNRLMKKAKKLCDDDIIMLTDFAERLSENENNS